jgi:transposase InsO family protein
LIFPGANETGPNEAWRSDTVTPEEEPVSIKSDPGRLPRRNHYQEGPGFLFVATEGGRPVVSTASPNPVGTVRARARALRSWTEGATVAEACGLGQCSRATLFRWRTRFDSDGLAGLLDVPRPGDRSDLEPALEQAILMVRMLSYWNSRRIAAEFSRRGIPVGHGAVDRLLARAGTNRTSVPRIPGPRYERSQPNDLWHIDLKGPFFLSTPTDGRRTCHFVGLVDDFSRYLLAIRAIPTKEAIPVLEALAEAVELCGVPHELMSDNGTPFVAIVRTMLSRFERTLADLAVRHIRTQIDTPWTNGKIESFWRILQAEVLDRQHLADLAAADTAVNIYAAYYNYHRLHGELGWHTPAERFDGTPFTDRGFEFVPALAGVADLLAELLAA